MKKYIVFTRALPGCCNKTSDAPSVVEVEGEIVSALEDPSVMFLPEGEFKFRISKPSFLHEMQEVKQADGTKKKTSVFPVYYSHAIYWTAIQARSVAEKMIREGLDFEVRKGRMTSYTDEELRVKCNEIQELLLE